MADVSRPGRTGLRGKMDGDSAQKGWGRERRKRPARKRGRGAQHRQMKRLTFHSQPRSSPVRTGVGGSCPHPPHPHPMHTASSSSPPPPLPPSSKGNKKKRGGEALTLLPLLCPSLHLASFHVSPRLIFSSTGEEGALAHKEKSAYTTSGTKEAPFPSLTLPEEGEDEGGTAHFPF